MIELNKNQRLVLIALAGVAVIGLTITHARNVVGRTSEVVIRDPGERGGAGVEADDSDAMPRPPSPSDLGKVVTHVTGCVRAPGVYSLDEGKRVVDAIRVAGGAKPHADLEALNLAAKVTDGSRIYVPPKGATVSPPNGVRISLAPTATASRAGPAGSASTSSSAKLTALGDGAVSINAADSSELQRLPGVGPSTAEKIIEYRGQIGRFTSVEQLLDVRGIGPKKLEKMRPFVAL